MKKRILIPGAVIGGIAVYLASQFLSFDLGDISVPKEKNMVSVKEQSSSTSADKAESRNDVPTQTVMEVPSEKSPENLLLVDIVIDGDRFNVSRVTNLVDAEATNQREQATLDEIIAMAGDAKGDKSGTRVRVSRTSEALASAETRLMDALQASGIGIDAIDKRNRLVE